MAARSTGASVRMATSGYKALNQPHLLEKAPHPQQIGASALVEPKLDYGRGNYSTARPC